MRPRGCTCRLPSEPCGPGGRTSPSGFPCLRLGCFCLLLFACFCKHVNGKAAVAGARGRTPASTGGGGVEGHDRSAGRSQTKEPDRNTIQRKAINGQWCGGTPAQANARDASGPGDRGFFPRAEVHVLCVSLLCPGEIKKKKKKVF